MVKIRLARLGKHKSPFYRIVATDSRNKRDGGYLALLGTYEPFSGKTTFDSELVIKFLNNGAVPSETVLNLLKVKGLYKTFLMQKPNKKTKKVKVKKSAAKKKLVAARKTNKAEKKKARSVKKTAKRAPKRAAKKSENQAEAK
ncbi:30S ribosomal protein S16 [Candidatus Malacoplasma girerdii]|uniref:Small ribosomal subunit protein bS16 n=1 Tax=Candidatus Malacoplasma girerdii TaxID=1318617 RepID=A0A097SSQ3_9BACT|nr:30S ribosomal protein S16 [Candidatus Malacoplasma girerdii]ASJ89017.1 MAG: 30S ribosomal protein S16 [Candidatus Malacoplasma girerdii]